MDRAEAVEFLANTRYHQEESQACTPPQDVDSLNDEFMNLKDQYDLLLHDLDILPPREGGGKGGDAPKSKNSDVEDMEIYSFCESLVASGLDDDECPYSPRPMKKEAITIPEPWNNSNNIPSMNLEDANGLLSMLKNTSQIGSDNGEPKFNSPQVHAAPVFSAPIAINGANTAMSRRSSMPGIGVTLTARAPTPGSQTQTQTQRPFKQQQRTKFERGGGRMQRRSSLPTHFVTTPPALERHVMTPPGVESCGADSLYDPTSLSRLQTPNFSKSDYETCDFFLK